MKKILAISLLTVFMLIIISFASTVTSDNSKIIRKESPLFNIRTRQAIREKIGDMMRRFVGERVFFLPFQWLKNRDFLSLRQRLVMKSAFTCNTFCEEPTCIHSTIDDCCHTVDC